MQLFFRFLALGAFLLAIVTFNGCPAPDEGCKDKDDCTAGQVCCKANESDEKGECKASDDCKKTPACDKKCQAKSDCSGNETCTDGCCKAGDGKDCQKHADCPTGNDCVPSGDKKVCVPCAAACTSATDCSGGGEKCENGCCRLPSCKVDDDCKGRDGKPFCNDKTGECVPCLKSEDCQQTDEQSICRSERCVKVECTKDVHCTDSNKPTCNQQNYKCTESPVCKNHSDCTDAQLNRCDPSADGGKGACKKGLCVQCTNDDECGTGKDFCVGQDKNLKDGRRCLTSCTDTVDCPTGFLCSPAVISGFKVCFPTTGYCEDPCKKISCKDTEVCVEGVCKPKPAPCIDCSKEGEKACLAGAECLSYPDGKFCGKACTSNADCPDDKDRDYTCLNGQCLAKKGCK